MRVLFLDIDGVLFTYNTSDTTKPNASCVAALQKIIDNVHPAIVISSSWKNLRRDFTEMLASFGLKNFNCIGSTPSIFSSDSIRGDEIRAWIDANGEPKHFVIVDDENDMGEFKPHLVRTIFKDGLTFDHADVIIRMLRD